MTGCAKRSERMFDDAHSTGLWFDHWIALAMVMKLHEMHGIKRACWLGRAGRVGLAAGMHAEALCGLALAEGGTKEKRGHERTSVENAKSLHKIDAATHMYTGTEMETHMQTHDVMSYHVHMHALILFLLPKCKKVWAYLFPMIV